MGCEEEVTTEEYVAHFDAKIMDKYPKTLSFKGASYRLTMKEFVYNGKQFLRIEVLDVSGNALALILHLVKTGSCRYHSPANSMFDISEELLGTEIGRFIMKSLLAELSKIGYSFIVERAYEQDLENKKFYESLGFNFISGLSGDLFVLKNLPLRPCEEECLSKIMKMDY